MEPIRSLYILILLKMTFPTLQLSSTLFTMDKCKYDPYVSRFLFVSFAGSITEASAAATIAISTTES